MGTISCHSNQSSYRTGIKNTTYVEVNVLSMYAKFRLHPVYGLREDFKTFLRKSTLFAAQQPIKFTDLVRIKNQKSRLVLTVQAFCEEKGLRSLYWVFGYAESKNQCWQAEKWLFIDLICIFSRWPPKTMELVLYR